MKQQFMKTGTLIAVPTIRFFNEVFISIRQPLVINAFFILGINLIPGFVGFIFWGIASRLYPASQIGLASASISSIVLISSIAGLGTNIGLIRFLAEERNQIGFLNSIFTFNFITSILFSITFVLGIEFFAPALVLIREDFLLFSIFIIFVEVATLGTNVRDTFVASRKAHFALFYALVANLSRLPLILLVVHLGAISIIGITTFGFFLALLVCLVFFVPKVIRNYHFFFRLEFRSIRNLIPYSIGNYLAGLLSQLNQTVIPIMVLNFLGPEDNAYAYIALMISGFLTSPGIALATSAFAEGSNDLKKIKSTLMEATSIGMLVTIPISFITGISANWLLEFFGHQYLEARNLLIYFAIASPFVVMVQLYFTYLRIYKFTKKLLFISGFISLITLSSSYFLIPRLEILGVGISFIFGYSCGSILILWELLQNLKRLNAWTL
jgi:O-antigen/teichoic acid export membrane protein